MSDRDTYPAGVPCWVDRLQPDPDAAVAFYGELFGWSFEGPGEMPGEPPGKYYVGRVRDRDAVGVGSAPDARSGSAWNTYVRVESADAAVERARAAGGDVLAGPFDAPPAGRLAVLTDPAGAPIGVWEAGDREGAQVVNEPAAWAMSLLVTDQPQAARAFYGAVFGWETEGFDVDGAQFWLWRLPGFVGGEPQQPVPRDVVAVLASAPPGTPSAWSVDFWVGDVDDVAARAARLGGRVVGEPATSSLGRQATLADPEGATFTVTRVSAG